jgi:hypothetical protein
LPCRILHAALKNTLTANEGPVITQYKGLVPIYVFLGNATDFQNRIVMFCLKVPTLIYLQRDLYISRIGLPILLQENMWIDPVNI